jgi:hypothetical protein
VKKILLTRSRRLRTVDADHDPDLFWALRGGRANFGIVTSYRTVRQPLSTCYGAGLFFDGADAGSMLHDYRVWIAGHSDRTSSSVALLRLPADPRLPDPIRGRFEHPLVVTELRNLGGAIARPPERPSAVPGREAAALLFTLALRVDVPELPGPQRRAG